MTRESFYVLAQIFAILSGTWLIASSTILHDYYIHKDNMDKYSEIIDSNDSSMDSSTKNRIIEIIMYNQDRMEESYNTRHDFIVYGVIFAILSVLAWIAGLFCPNEIVRRR